MTFDVLYLEWIRDETVAQLLLNLLSVVVGVGGNDLTGSDPNAEYLDFQNLIKATDKRLFSARETVGKKFLMSRGASSELSSKLSSEFIFHKKQIDDLSVNNYDPYVL